MPIDRQKSGGAPAILTLGEDDPGVPEFTRLRGTKKSDSDFSSKNLGSGNGTNFNDRKRLLIIALAILIASGIFYHEKLATMWREIFRSEVGYLSIPLLPPTEPSLLPKLIGNEVKTISARVKKGDSLQSLLNRFAIPESQISTLEKLISAKRSEQSGSGQTGSGQSSTGQEELGAIPVPGKIITLNLSDEGLLEQLEATLPSEAIALFVRNEDGSFSFSLNTSDQRMNERVAIGTIESSFSAAAVRAGVPYALVDDLVDLFSNRVEFKKDFRPGDRFTIIYKDHIVKAGKIISPGPILAAALEVNDEHLVAVRYVGSDGKERYFNEKGELLGNGFLRYPLQFSRISSVFTNARFHPVLKISRPHNGVDFAAPTGTPVRAVADAAVVFAGSKGGNGNMVKLKHSDRYETAYLHLSSIAKGVSPGKRVHRGEVIGAVGMSGLATGPHLHFSFYDNGKYVDPLSIKLPTLDELSPGSGIDKRYLARVLQTIEHYQTATLSGYYAAVNAFGR